jgi:hypothetical protein
VIYRDLLQQKTGVTWCAVFVNAHGATTGIGNLVLRSCRSSRPQPTS